MSKQMSTGKCFTSSSFIPMQDRCENTDQKSKDNERSTEKGRGYIRSIDSQKYVQKQNGQEDGFLFFCTLSLIIFTKYYRKQS